MPTSSSINKVCMFPKQAVEVGYSLDITKEVSAEKDQNIFYAMMPAGTRKLSVLNSITDFRQSYCNNCPRFCTKDHLREETKKRNLITTTFNMVKVREELSLCTANEEDIETCPEGHQFVPHSYLEIEVLPHLWLFKTDEKTAQSLQLFIYNEMTTPDGQQILLQPYHIPNVYQSGVACWGKKNPVPADIRAAETFFWESNFNDSITECKNRSFSDVFTEMNQAHYNEDFSKPISRLDVTKLARVSGEFKPDGAFVTNNPKIIDKFPSEVLTGDYLHGFIYELPGKLLVYRIGDLLFLKEGSSKSITNVKYLGTASDFHRLAV